MRVVAIEEAFGLSHLRVAERAVPEPGPGEIVLRMRAASLNYRDLLVVLGKYNPKLSLPLIPLSDGVGTVVAVGPGVTRVAEGDRVCPIFAQRWLDGRVTKEALKSTLGSPHDGVAAEYVRCSADGVVVPPAHLTDVEAATLPCAALTAWSAIVEQGHVGPDHTVLIQGTGGVSLFALTFAKLCGARVILTSSSDDKLARGTELGADLTINYRTHEAWGKRVLELTEGRGVDHIVEVGGAGTLGQSLRCIAPGGAISLIGVLAGGGGELNLHPILMQNVRVQGVFVGHRRGFEAMNRAIAQHALRPIIDRTFELAELAAALRHLESGAHFGKIAIRYGDEA